MNAKRSILLLAIFLFTAAFAFAQYGRGPYGRDHYDRGRRANRVTVQGCLYGGGGQYVLVDRFGNSYGVHGRTGGFDFFVGHRVRLTGRSWFNPERPYSSGSPTLRVEWVEHVSHRTCEEMRGERRERRRSEPQPGLNFQIPIP